MFFYMACCILQIGTGARANDGDVEYKRLILASGVAVKECPHLRSFIHSQMVGSVELSTTGSSLLEGPSKCLQRKIGLCSREI